MYNYSHSGQCVYDDEKSPCKLCKESGLSCGSKYWGPKTEIKRADRITNGTQVDEVVLFLDKPISKPENEVITPIDDIGSVMRPEQFTVVEEEVSRRDRKAEQLSIHF